jgi:hypothetical protein
MTGFRGVDRTSTHKYKDTIHVIFQGIDLGVIVALSFISEECPERIRTAIEIPYHSWFFRFLFMHEV